MTTKAYKTDIFDLMRRIDKGDHQLWSKLTEEERKGLSPLLVMKWMSGTSDLRQIVFLNTLANVVVFPLAKHPELLLKLLTVCSSKVAEPCGRGREEVLRVLIAQGKGSASTPEQRADCRNGGRAWVSEGRTHGLK
jgi:hypothetical protein